MIGCLSLNVAVGLIKNGDTKGRIAVLQALLDSESKSKKVRGRGIEPL